MSHRRTPLSEGFTTELGLQAHVLGFRVLTIDATVLVAPAAAEVAAEPVSRRSAARKPVGHDLERATRFIDEGRAALAAARGNGAGRLG